MRRCTRSRTPSGRSPQFAPIGYDEELEVAPGVRATFLDAGHILGSAIIRLRVQDTTGGEERIIVCSGDLGRPGTPILRDPTILTAADYVLVESTYGGREHEPAGRGDPDPRRDDPPRQRRRRACCSCPSFAIGRTQEVVWQLDRLIERGEIPLLPLYLDSPMASKASDIYRRHPEYYDEETAQAPARGRRRRSTTRTRSITNDVKESQAIERAPRPYMIVASNGMLTGGRVVGHLRNLIDDPSATILFVGYQGEGTLGAHLQAGATAGQARRPAPRRPLPGPLDQRLLGPRRRERAARLAASASPPASEPGDPGYPRRVFLVHGDPEAQVALEPKVRDARLRDARPALARAGDAGITAPGCARPAILPKLWTCIPMWSRGRVRLGLISGEIGLVPGLGPVRDRASPVRLGAGPPAGRSGDLRVGVRSWAMEQRVHQAGHEGHWTAHIGPSRARTQGDTAGHEPRHRPPRRPTPPRCISGRGIGARRSSRRPSRRGAARTTSTTTCTCRATTPTRSRSTGRCSTA